MPTIATAGHIDHGKSTLVRALTGQDPDRLKEEKSRGLTIDLGFAWTTLDSGIELAFVDVPGHQKFITNMLAGAGSVSACLFVVSAREKMMPQSWEHLHIMELLGVREGVVAVTKSSGLMEEELESAILEIQSELAGSFLETSEIVAVDSVEKMGLEEVRSALNKLVSEHRQADEGHLGDATDIEKSLGRPRLWVDRSFTASGSGTVVTGTLTHGNISLGDELMVFPVSSGKQARKVRIRAIQSLGKAEQSLSPDTRTALNLTGISKDEIGRGNILVKEGQWFTTKVFDADIHFLPSDPSSGSSSPKLSSKGAYMVYLGSGSFPVRIAVLGSGGSKGRSADSGATDSEPSVKIRIYLEMEIPLKVGDRYVLRDLGRSRTVGGGRILDLNPVLAPSKACPDGSPARLLSERGGWIKTQDLDLLIEPSASNLEAKKAFIQLGGWSVLESALREVRLGLEEKLKAAGGTGIATADLSEIEIEVIKTYGDVRLTGSKAYLESTKTDATHPYLKSLEENLFAPPDPAGHIEKDVLRDLVLNDLVVSTGGIFFSPVAISRAKSKISELLVLNPQGFSVSRFRSALGTSRKYALALLGYFDETAVTKRHGDVRLGGPRL